MNINKITLQSLQKNMHTKKTTAAFVCIHLRKINKLIWAVNTILDKSALRPIFKNNNWKYLWACFLFWLHLFLGWSCIFCLSSSILYLLENLFIDIICRHLHKRKENMSNRKYCLHSYLPILDIWTKIQTVVHCKGSEEQKENFTNFIYNWYQY